MFNFILLSMQILTVISAVVSVISFVSFAKARMRENERREQLYKKIHFTALVIFCIAGVVLLNMLASMEVH